MTIADVLRALDTLDRMEREVSDFEADLLDSMKRRLRSSGRLPSAKQHRILCEMVEKYLDDPGLLRVLQGKTSSLVPSR